MNCVTVFLELFSFIPQQETNLETAFILILYALVCTFFSNFVWCLCLQRGSGDRPAGEPGGGEESYCGHPRQDKPTQDRPGHPAQVGQALWKKYTVDIRRCSVDTSMVPVLTYLCCTPFIFYETGFSWIFFNAVSDPDQVLTNFVKNYVMKGLL